MAHFSDYSGAIRALGFIDPKRRDRMTHLLRQNVAPSRGICYDTLDQLGVMPETRIHLQRMRVWDLLVRLTETKTYPVLTVEFLISYTYSPGSVSFRLDGQSFSWSSIQFNEALSLPRYMFLSPAISQSSLDTFWDWVTRNTPKRIFPPLLSRDIADPYLRVAQQLVTHALLKTEGFHGSIID